MAKKTQRHQRVQVNWPTVAAMVAAVAALIEAFNGCRWR